VLETKQRVDFISKVLNSAGAKGIIFGNSGGKDCALVGILCKMACENTLSLMLPCGTTRSYGSDLDDATALAAQFGIEYRTVDLAAARDALAGAISDQADATETALSNLLPRLRMATLYTIAQSEGRLVAGTGNRSEIYMGYFTKWGDGASDFNPIADLTATEVYEFLAHLGAPDFLFSKPPSAGLFEGQTDEADMGVTYKAIDGYLLTGQASPEDKLVIERYHNSSSHKRVMPVVFDPAIYGI